MSHIGRVKISHPVDDARRTSIRSELFVYAVALLDEAPKGIKDLRLPESEREKLTLVNDLKHYPHAFVLGCVVDRQVSAELAWMLPGRFKERLGSFEFDALRKLTLPQVRRYFHEPDPLHRFPNMMAETFHSAVQRIAAD